MQPQQQFGLNMRRYRTRAGISQEELSRRTKLHVSEISRLERGAREPRLGTIVRVARGLGIAPSRLLTGMS